MMVGKDVDAATLEKQIAELDPTYNIRATSADGNLDMVLDMAKRLCDGPGKRPPISKAKTTNHDRTSNPDRWVPCVAAHRTSQSIVCNSSHSLL